MTLRYESNYFNLVWVSVVDVDSTIITRCGQQQGAANYNHMILLFDLGVLCGWLFFHLTTACKLP